MLSLDGPPIVVVHFRGYPVHFVGVFIANAPDAVHLGECREMVEKIFNEVHGDWREARKSYCLLTEMSKHE